MEDELYLEENKTGEFARIGYDEPVEEPVDEEVADYEQEIIDEPIEAPIEEMPEPALYVLVDSDNNILDAEISRVLPDDRWVEVEYYAFGLPYQDNYEFYNYQLIDGKVVQVDNSAKIDKINQIEELEAQLKEHYAWFDEYDNQIKQYERDVRLSITGTYHIGDNEYTITELDNQATVRATIISYLREQIKNL